MIIGLAGYAQSGKDSAAKTLVEEHGFVRLAFADKLRECVYALDPQVTIWHGPDTYQTNAELTTVQEIVATEGWDGAKQHDEVRRLLQVMGTEVGRELIDQDVWLNLVRKQIRRGVDYVITDVRFLTEFEAVHSWGGEVWRIVRDGTGPVNAHKSESELDDSVFDAQLNNNGSLESLADLVHLAVGGYAR